MSTRRDILRWRGRSPALPGWRHQSELVARRGMLLIVIAAMLLAGGMVLATSIASLR